MIEIFNEAQQNFLRSEKVRKQVRAKSGIDILSGDRYWWIGAELKSGTWYWTHSNQPITYVPRIGGRGSFDKNQRYGALYMHSTTTAYWKDKNNSCYYPICQISE